MFFPDLNPYVALLLVLGVVVCVMWMFVTTLHSKRIATVLSAIALIVYCAFAYRYIHFTQPLKSERSSCPALTLIM